MKTVEEAVNALDFSEGSAHSIDLKELSLDGRLLIYVIAIADSRDEGYCTKLLRAICLGVIIRRETQR